MAKRGNMVVAEKCLLKHNKFNLVKDIKYCERVVVCREERRKLFNNKLNSLYLILEQKMKKVINNKPKSL